MGFSPWFPDNFPLTIHISDVIRISHDVPPFYPHVGGFWSKKWLVKTALGITHPLQAGLLSKTRRVARGLASWSTGEDSWLGAAGAANDCANILQK